MTSALALEFMPQHRAKSEPHRGVEQLVARRAHNPKVVGSSPTPATKKKKESAQAGSFTFTTLKYSVYWHNYLTPTPYPMLKRTHPQPCGWLYE